MVALVIGLLFVCGPFAVRRLVTFIVIDTFYGQMRLVAIHNCPVVKVAVVLPFFTNRNATGSVISKGL